MKPSRLEKMCQISQTDMLCFPFVKEALGPPSVTVENAFLNFTAFGKLNFIEQSPAL